MSKLESAEQKEKKKTGEGALDSFYFVLKTPATQKQYPIRLKIYFDCLEIPGETVEEQAAAFLDELEKQKGENWAQDCLIRFITHQKQRIADNQIAAGTLDNYVGI